jgi:hypothetical protein
LSCEEIMRKARELDEEKAKQFDPDELIRGARELRTARDEELGLVRYRVLTMREMLELSKIQNEEERSLRMIHMMLADAYPTLTVEKLKELPASKAIRLMNLLLEKAGFQKKP